MATPLTTRIGNFSIPSQDISVYKGSKKDLQLYLDEFIPFWVDLEATTGHRWKATSWLRNSPSHKHGYALDLAPDISPRSSHLYSVSQLSDPVLYKRTVLMRSLQNLCQTHQPRRYSIGIYVEPDHLHVHLMQPEGRKEVRLFKWKQPKPIYHDTFDRVKLPMS